MHRGAIRIILRKSSNRNAFSTTASYDPITLKVIGSFLQKKSADEDRAVPERRMLQIAMRRDCAFRRGSTTRSPEGVKGGGDEGIRTLDTP